MVEVAGLIVSVVALLLDRLDKREDKLTDRLDLREALFALYCLVRDWSEAMGRTNQALEAWIARGKPADRGGIHADRISAVNVVTGVQVQMAYDAIDILDSRISVTGGANPHRRAANTTLADVLSVYAPELRQSLQTVFDTRSKQLARLQAELKSYPGNRSIMAGIMRALGIDDRDANLEKLKAEDIEPFLQAETSMRQASERLAHFIADRFPLGSEELDG